MLHRIISSRTFTTSLLLVSLVGLAAPACDGGDDDSCDDGGGDDGGGDDGADDGGDDGADDGGDDGGGDGFDDGGGDGFDDGGDGADDGGDGADDGADDGGGGGGVGDQCQDNTDCASNSCIFAGDVDFGICTVVCEDFTDCPDFWSCEEIGNATGTYCVPD